MSERPAAPGKGIAATLPETRPASLAAALPEAEVSLLELADRLLNKGVVLVGEATISVAGVDLIYLGLNVVLSSVETLREHGRARAASADRQT